MAFLKSGALQIYCNEYVRFDTKAAIHEVLKSKSLLRQTKADQKSEISLVYNVLAQEDTAKMKSILLRRLGVILHIVEAMCKFGDDIVDKYRKQDYEVKIGNLCHKVQKYSELIRVY